MKNRISYKLITTVGSVSVAIIAVFSYVIIHSQHKALISLIEQNAHQVSETIKSSTKYDMLLNQRNQVHRIIDTIGKQEGIEKIRIFNKEGEIIYSSVKSEIGDFVNKQGESCYACHTADRPLERLSVPERTRIFAVQGKIKNLGIINPIYNEPGCWQADCHAHAEGNKVLGVLDVTMSLAEVEQQIHANQVKMAIFALSAIVVISFIIWFLVHNLIGKPVNALMQATNVVAAGNLDYQIKVHNKDELGHLANSFNEMTQKLAEAQRQLFQSEKLASLGRLAAGVAHEINNPLTGVLTYSSFLLKRSRDNGELKNDLEVIVRETKRCRDIVKGLLDFARQVPAQKSPCAIHEAIELAISVVENQLRLNNISVHKEFPDGLPTIEADVNQMQQVFVNLLLNANDAIGPAGGDIVISTELRKVDDREFVVVHFSDTGRGIERQHLTKIFEPFFSTKGQRGTGLGLAVVWGIIDKHGGTIDVQSEVGKGTTFTIKLPIGDSRHSPLIVQGTNHAAGA